MTDDPICMRCEGTGVLPYSNLICLDCGGSRYQPKTREAEIDFAGTPAHVREQFIKLREERDELQRIFDLNYAADMRAIKLWQAERPEERQLSWPDRCDHVVWLLNQLDSYGCIGLEVGKDDKGMPVLVKTRGIGPDEVRMPVSRELSVEFAEAILGVEDTFARERDDHEERLVRLEGHIVRIEKKLGIT